MGERGREKRDRRREKIIVMSYRRKVREEEEKGAGHMHIDWNRSL